MSYNKRLVVEKINEKLIDNETKFNSLFFSLDLFGYITI